MSNAFFYHKEGENYFLFAVILCNILHEYTKKLLAKVCLIHTSGVMRSDFFRGEYTDQRIFIKKKV
jgi:hypothetical protein